MNALLTRWLSGRTERERRIVLSGALAAVLLLVLAVLLPLQHSVGAAEQRVERKRGDLAWLRSIAPQLGGLPAAAPAVPRESLVVLVDRTARAAGLTQSLLGSQPSGGGGLSVHFQQAPFDRLVAWLAGLRETYGVQAESATVDAAQSAGMVNASLVLRIP